MLLHIMPLTRNIRRDDFSTAQSYSGDFALAGIGLLGLRGADSQTHAFHLRTVDERWRCGFARTLLGAAAAEDLVVCCFEGGYGGEGAAGEGGVGGCEG
jgi:hypothetical protein